VISAVKLLVGPTQAAVTTVDPSGVMTGLNRPLSPAGSLPAETIRREAASTDCLVDVRVSGRRMPAAAFSRLASGCHWNAR
jgi:hypothetical protein